MFFITIVDTQTVLICFDCMVWFVAMSMFDMFVTGLLQSLYLPPAAAGRGRRERGHLALRQGAAAPLNAAWALDVPNLATALMFVMPH